MIVVATTDFEVYHGVVQALRDRSVEFTTVETNQPLPERTSLVIVGPGETVDPPAEIPVVTARPGAPRRAVEDALARLRIGDGARLIGSRIIDDIDAAVELVDETGTTPYLGTGAREMGDVLAAVNIARIEGEPTDSREIEPTAGEIQRIKERSREESETNRAIDETLARRVAVGELTIGEALAAHREE